MKKLHRKGTVHPSPQTKPDDHLSLLPAAVLTLAAALLPEDREVLAYLISSSSINTHNKSSGFDSSGQRRNQRVYSYSNSNNDHSPMFRCDCFSCYMSYWVRWDSSPNRQLIHEIIDAFEDRLEKNKKAVKKDGKKERRKRGKRSVDGGGDEENTNSGEVTRSDDLGFGKNVSDDGSDPAEERGGGSGGGETCDEKGTEKGSVRRFMTFIGERILGVWG